MRTRRLLKTLLIGFLLALEVPGHRKFTAVDSSGALRQVFGPNEAYRGAGRALQDLSGGRARETLRAFFFEGAEPGSSMRAGTGPSWGESLERMRPMGADAPAPGAGFGRAAEQVSASPQASPARDLPLDRSPPVRPLLN